MAESHVRCVPLSILLDSIERILFFASRYGSFYTDRSPSPFIAWTAVLLNIWARAMIPILLSAAGSGIHHVMSSELAGRERLVRSLALVLGGFSAVMAIPIFAVFVYAHAESMSSNPYGIVIEAADHMVRLHTALNFMILVASVIVAVWSFTIKSSQWIRSVSKLFIGANCINVLGAAWEMMYQILYSYFPSSFAESAYWIRMMLLLLSTWGTALILALVFIALKKQLSMKRAKNDREASM
ncbi:hypothetical protein BN1723_009660 [Verticillium longisporum]|uniref:Uncharacterized protein n=1 Tax=Verticillium longisporum TaxID=100787 RepID=A0A0G4KQY3_VERLO|nr:hypothetical protein HYQ44_020030 [Verticillium longisporum]KAG7148597.1 hypothetical protein HYQ46_002546 [Verticillium longisporum]CRK12218.1 hypothetical protein BN1723_009660 [Verticillium longisporum]